MTATSYRRAILPALIACWALAPPRASSQCLTDDWVTYASTGDVTEVETSGNVAWIGAYGGVIRIDLSGIAQGNPSQFRIDDSRGLVSADVTCLALDGFGNVYVGTRKSGISVFDSQGRHLADLSSFDEYLWSDNVVTMDALRDTTSQWEGKAPNDTTTYTVTGDRVLVASADSFSPTGTFEGGGLKSIFVTRTSDGFAFYHEPGLGANYQQELVRELLVEPGVVWIGTAGLGVYRRDETVSPPTRENVLTTTNGLLDATVRHIVRGPSPSNGSVLWIGTGAGLQFWNGVDPPTTVVDLAGQNILDVSVAGNDVWVLAETPTFSRDLYRIDATSPALFPERIPRSTCLADTLYVPREVAVDASGRVVMGTREDSFTVLDGGSWLCAPPLGPHSHTIAGLVLGPDGVLYFGTGDKNKVARSNGLGWFNGTEWFAATPTTDPQMLDVNVTEVVAWPDSTVWFGTTLDANNGGLNHLFPRDRAMERYTPQSPTGRITQGRNIWDMTLDAQSNLWVAYGQAGGGLSVIEYPSLLVTNFDFNTMFGGTTTQLRSVAVDTRGRVWVGTNSLAEQPGQLYVVDPRGTISNQSDDLKAQFNVANEIADVAPIPYIAIDSTDRIWLAGEKGLVVGQIGPDVGGRPSVAWNVVNPSGGQLGGRNPLPYTTGALDWDENLWLGTESAGLVRISKDLQTWTWFDATEGCPLPDPAITGLYIDVVSRRVYVGTATGGIARIDLSAVGKEQGGGFSAGPSPNPWRPAEASILTLTGIPADEVATVRVYTLAGELVHEQKDVRGAKTWDGRNLGDQLVEAGVYLVRAVSPSGKVYESKVAVIR